MAGKESVEEAVADYLMRTRDRFAIGSDEYYARLALEQAMLASREGNYGIGAVAVDVVNVRVRELRDRSAVITGLGVIDHAETRAILRLVADGDADDEYRLDDDRPLPTGISVYGTLEPCPMCTCTLTNAGATRSVSTVIDGRLVEDDGLVTTDGSATAIGRKALLQPKVWRAIQEALGLRFELLATDDRELVDLSSEIFIAGRARVDEQIARRQSGRARPSR